MTIPLAVSPSAKAPGVYMTVNLLAGAPSPGTGALRVALLAQKTSAGDLTNNTEVRAGGGPESAATAYGPGGLGHLAAKRLYAQYPAALVDFMSVPDGSTAATLTITIANSPATAQVLDCDVMGRTYEVVWNAGETANDLRDRLISATNALSDDLFVTASSGGSGSVVLTAKSLGKVGNDVLAKFKLRLAQTSGSETVTGALTHTALAGGTTDPDYTTALAALDGREYHFILPCLSNADVSNVSSTNNAKRTRSHITAHDTGLDAKLETFCCGYTGTLGGATPTTVDSDSFGNIEFGELALCIAGRSLPCEWAGWEVGDWLAKLSLDPAANRINTVCAGLYGAADKIASKPTVANIETALANGVTIFSYTQQGLEYVVRPVTTHSQTTAGGPDARLLDMQMVHAAYIVSRDVRDALPLAFPNAKIVKDVAPGDEPPPAGVLEERDVKGFVISRLRPFVRNGVITQASLDAAIADGTLIVMVNPNDATQVDIVMPYKVVPPLAKFGVVSNRLPN